MEATTLGTLDDGSERKLRMEKYAAYLACTLTCAYNGVVYAFPMLSVKLKAQGLSSSNVVIAGLMLQLGYGLISYPFARAYMNPRLAASMSPQSIDRLMSAVSAIVTLLALGLMIGGSVYADVSGQPISMALFCVGFAVWSAGLGISFYQSMTIANYLFAGNKALRRKAVAFNAFALGIGSMTWVVLFYYGMSKLSLVNNLVVMTVIYTCVAVFRLVFMVRGRFDVPGPVEAPPILPPMTPGVVVQPSPADQERAGADVEQVRVDEGAELGAIATNNLGPAPEATIATQSPTRKDYWTSPVVWLTSVSAFFAYGIGSVALNSLQNTASLLVEDESLVDATTFSLTITFLAWIILSRIVTTLIYAHLNWPHVNTMWNVLLFLGMVVYTAYPTLKGAYLMASLVGFGFGGIVSTMAVISTVSFPGGIADNSVNMSIAFTVTSVGPFLLGLIKNAIYEKANESGLNTDSFNNLSTYIFYLCATFFSTACSVALSYHLKKAFKLEKQELREAALRKSSVPSVDMAGNSDLETAAQHVELRRI